MKKKWRMPESIDDKEENPFFTGVINMLLPCLFFWAIILYIMLY